jgi:hypothetical protein
MENVTIFYGNLEYFTAIWYILWPFVNVVVVWYIFPRFGTFCQEKSGNPVRCNLLRKKAHSINIYREVFFLLDM